MARREQDTRLRQRFRALLSPKRIWGVAREVGFVQRSGGKINPFKLVWTLTLGFGQGKERTLTGLRRCFMRVAKVRLAPASFSERFDGRLVELLRRLVAHLVEATVAPVLQLSGSFEGFSDVTIADASVLRLHELLEQQFPACRTNHTKAAAKLHMVMSATGRNAHTVKVTGERTNDRRELRIGPWVRDRLLLFDLGYFGYRLFDRIRRNGGFFISRMKTNSNPIIVSANRRWRGRALAVVGMPLREVLDRLTRKILDVNIEVTFSRRTYLGRCSRVKATFRFVAVRNDETGEYHTYVTNVPVERLDAEQIARAYEARWQVELMFRAWKSEFRLDEFPSPRREVVEALIYAALITMLVTQSLLAYFRAKAGDDARRVTFGRVAAALRHFAADLLALVTQPSRVADVVHLGCIFDREVLDPHLDRPLLLERASATGRKVA